MVPGTHFPQPFFVRRCAWNTPRTQTAASCAIDKQDTPILFPRRIMRNKGNTLQGRGTKQGWPRVRMLLDKCKGTPAGVVPLRKLLALREQ